MTKSTLPAPKVRAVDLLNDYHIDPFEVAKWIIDERIQIVGILKTAQKSSPYEEPKLHEVSKLDDSKFQDLVQMRTQELRILLKSRSDLIDRVNKKSGVSFDLVDQIPEIEEKIQTVVGRFVFDRDSFEELYIIDGIPPTEDEGMPPDVDNDTPPAVLCSDRHLPKQHDIQDKETQPANNLEITVINEAVRCFNVYDLLRRTDMLSHENWIKRIESLELTILIPTDVQDVQLYHSTRHRKRNIITNLATAALSRLGVKYNVKEIDKIRKSLSSKCHKTVPKHGE